MYGLGPDDPTGRGLRRPVGRSMFAAIPVVFADMFRRFLSLLGH